MDFFSRLAEVIEARWQAKGYDEAAFPEIAERSLRESGFSEAVAPTEVALWLARAQGLPAQTLDSTISDFQLQVFQNDRFVISVLFWVNGTVSIHQHYFSGAFGVLSGSSVHATWGFALHDRITPALCLGDVSERTSELLRAGDVRQILAGEKFIHSLFHLDRPSVSVVIRTNDQAQLAPPCDYFKPAQGVGLGINAFHLKPILKRQLSCVAMLATTRDPALFGFVREALSGTDAFGATFLVQAAWAPLHGDPRLSSLIEYASERFGALVDVLVPVVAEYGRSREIAAKRATHGDAELRFFLALLMNMRSRSRLLQLVTDRFPLQDPVTTVTGWVERILVADPSFLGAPVEASELVLLRALLRHGSVDAALVEVSDGNEVAASSRLARLRGAHLLAPLFVGP